MSEPEPRTHPDADPDDAAPASLLAEVVGTLWRHRRWVLLPILLVLLLLGAFLGLGDAGDAPFVYELY